MHLCFVCKFTVLIVTPEKKKRPIGTECIYHFLTNT